MGAGTNVVKIMHRRAFLTLAGAAALSVTASKAEAAYYEGAEYVYYDTWEAPGTIIINTGERWLYHTGSDVLGVLLARASGQSYMGRAAMVIASSDERA